MSNRYKILLVITSLGLASQSLFAADWDTDCKTVESQSPDAKKMCSAITEESTYLNSMMTPPPFLAEKEMGKYPDSIFPPGGLPWGNMPSGGNAGGGGVLPPEGGTPNSGGDTGGGAWQ